MHDSKDPERGAEFKPPGIIESGIRQITLAAVLIFWSVAGILICIPMVIRVAGFYCTMVVVSVFEKINFAAVQHRLDHCINIYPATFGRILENHARQFSNDEIPEMEPIKVMGFIRRHWLDIVWIPSFWLIPYVYFFPDHRMAIIISLLAGLLFASTLFIIVQTIKKICG